MPGLSSQHAGTFNSSSMCDAIICWGLPNLCSKTSIADLENVFLNLPFQMFFKSALSRARLGTRLGESNGKFDILTVHYACSNKIKKIFIRLQTWILTLTIVLFWFCISLGKLILFYYSRILVADRRYMKITVCGTHLPYSNSREIYNSDSLCYLKIVSMCGAVTSLGKVIEIC